jgi:hypothetical protein
MIDSVYEEIPDAILRGLYEQASALTVAAPAPPNPKPQITRAVRAPNIRDVVITRDNDIKLPHNIQIKERLLDLFEQMSVYRAHYAFRNELLADIRRIQKNLSTSIVGVKYSTPWGEFMFKEALKTSERKELAIEALSRMGIPIDLDNPRCNKYVIIFETGGLCRYPNVLKTYQQISGEFIKGTWDKAYQSNVNSLHVIPPNIVYVTKALKWIREHEHEASQYRILYNKAKDLFKTASYNSRSEKPDGKFPRIFGHNMVNMYWKDVTFSLNFAQRLSAYFIDAHDQYREYKGHLKDIWDERNEQRLAMIRDGYDHEQNDESDYDN